MLRVILFSLLVLSMALTAFVPEEWNCRIDNVTNILDSFVLIEEQAPTGMESPGD